MKKEETKLVKRAVDEITGCNYTKTFASKSETLHIRIGTYSDNYLRSLKDGDEWLDEKLAERKRIIVELKKRFPQYTILENNKRYQGFINDICITIK